MRFAVWSRPLENSWPRGKARDSRSALRERYAVYAQEKSAKRNLAMTDRERWWHVISYELWMLGATLNMAAWPGAPSNAVTEVRVLHARNMCDFCSPKRASDIEPQDLFDNYDAAAEYSALRVLVADVKAAYETDACRVPLPPDGKSTALKSPRWVFGKMLAHPTQDRGTFFNYQSALAFVEPKVKLVAEELTRLEKTQGRDFPRTSAPCASV
jgi:hypothetical protein